MGRAAARDMAADMACTRQGAGVDPLLAARTCRRWAALRKLRFGGVAPHAMGLIGRLLRYSTSGSLTRHAKGADGAEGTVQGAPL